MREIKFKSYVREYDNVIRSYIWEPFEAYPQESDNTLKGELLGSRLQFTGLKDKNGKEIYEGDILVDNCIIVWRDDLASFAIRKDGWMYDHYFGEAIDAGRCEVIGNIYENKELMNQPEPNRGPLYELPDEL